MISDKHLVHSVCQCKQLVCGLHFEQCALLISLHLLLASNRYVETHRQTYNPTILFTFISSISKHKKKIHHTCKIYKIKRYVHLYFVNRKDILTLLCFFIFVFFYLFHSLSFLSFKCD